MDDRRAGFLIAVGDLCAAAHVANLSVRVVTQDGATFTGIPQPCFVGDSNAEGVDDTGLRNRLYVGEHAVELEHIAAVMLHAP